MNADELTVLYQTALDLAGNHELPELLQTVVARAQALVGAGSAALGLYDPIYDEIQLAVQTGQRVTLNFRRRRGDGMVGHVIGTRQPLIVNDYPNSQFYAAAAPAQPPIRAALNIPLLYRDELLGVLSLYEGLDSPRAFSSDDARTVTALVALAASAVKNARLRLQAQRRAEMDRIVAGIATRFIRLAPDRLDGEINATLRVIGEFAQVDRAYLFRVSADGKAMSNTHEWCAPGIAPQIGCLQNLLVETMPWAMNRLAQGLVIHVRQLDELPPAAAVEKQVLAAQGIQSVALIPLQSSPQPAGQSAGLTLGFIGFDAVRQERSWSEHDITLLKLIAEVFTLALKQAQTEQELQQRQQEFATLAEFVPDVLALLDSKQFVERITETGPMLIFVYDLPAGRNLYINHVAAEFFGYTPAEVAALGDDFLAAAIHPDDLAAVLAKNACYPQLGAGEVYELEMRARRQDGVWRWLLARDSVFQRAADGRPQQVVSVCLDITELKQSELTRQEAESALRAALAQERELGELKSRFVAMASHEFRTPLAAIRVNAEMLLYQRACLGDAAVGERLSRICNQVEHLGQLIEQILSLTNVQAGKIVARLEPLEFDQFCRQIVAEFASRADLAHALHYAGSATPLRTQADPKLLRAVVANLIANAIKYSPAGSSVCIAAGRREGWVALTVADSGIGIPERDQPRLFEAFHRASNVGGIAGTGLGLSIAKEFLQLMHGSISFASTPGGGATFEILLPGELELNLHQIADHEKAKALFK